MLTRKEYIEIKELIKSFDLEYVHIPRSNHITIKQHLGEYDNSRSFVLDTIYPLRYNTQVCDMLYELGVLLMDEIISAMKRIKKYD